MRAWFLHFLNWVQQLQSKFKHRLIKTTPFAFPILPRDKHTCPRASDWWEVTHAKPCLQDSLTPGLPHPHMHYVSPLWLEVRAHSVHIFIQETFSDTGSHLLNSFSACSGSVLRILRTLFSPKIPHDGHLTEEGSRLGNLLRVTQETDLEYK